LVPKVKAVYFFPSGLLYLNFCLVLISVCRSCSWWLHSCCRRCSCL